MARFDRLSVYQTMLQGGVVPLFYHAELGKALWIAAAVNQGGGRVLEFTNRGDFALEVFSDLVMRCRTEHPNLILGVGSVEDASTAALYLAHGANFIVAPSFSEEVARLCNRRKVAYVPGCSTVTEIARAEEWGAEIVKLFPAGPSGGPAFIKAVLGPRPWTRIMPTGGVGTDEENLRGWFTAGAACVGIGSELIRKSQIEAGEFEQLEAEMRNVLARIERVRSEG
jgi:2-dehydro-3-deoxyphosphogluconate aldolase/(4S)-4-hydroxy-2-oxoglutarate aldolase